ncbi:MAG: SpoIIE family protein phosphatase [Desulfobacterales bacterium]|jgi:sigma-B regulation protein RsbU (phosphoserine phosphatase)
MTEHKKPDRNFWRSSARATARKFGIVSIGGNMVGAVIVTVYFTFFDQPLLIKEIQKTFIVVGIMSVGLVIMATLFLRNWQKDIDRYLQLKTTDQEPDSDLQQRVQRKILNLPFASTLMSMFNWLLAAIIMTIYNNFILPETKQPLNAMLLGGLQTFIGIVIAGIVTCAIIYLSLEVYCRKIWPYFFPDGGLIQTSGVFRLKLQTRMFIIFMLASLLPIILMAVLSYNKARMMLVMNPEYVIRSLLYLTAFLLAVALGVAAILSRLFSSSIIRPVSRMEAAMARVEAGDFGATVAVNTNDELGALAEHFNQMTEGLKERVRLRRSLDLAKEVQQNLLPQKTPDVHGLDIAGRSIYCDETGGDYYDFLDSQELGEGKLGVLIGDVSGHGLPSALLMATARAFLRQRSDLPGSLDVMISDVNRQLTRDVEESGRFMTLFYLMIDLTNQKLSWVRAGHDPAVFYDPATDRFEELRGSGMALGVDAEGQYAQYVKSNLKPGQIILLGTDGIWETQNPDGEMFGKKRVCEIIRKESNAAAEKILDTIVTEVQRFRKKLDPADDITLVVIKIKKNL